MRKYIKAELYRSFNRRYYRNFIIIVSLLAISLNLLLSVPDFMNQKAMFENLFGLLSMGLYFVVIFVDIITSEEFKNKTIKNTVSSGIPRKKIVLGKIIVTILLAIIALVIILFVYILSGYLALDKIPSYEIKNYLIILKNILVGLVPIWIAGVCIMTFFALNIESSIGSVIAYYVFVVIIPKLLEILYFIFDLEILNKISSRFGIINIINRLIKSTSISWEAFFIGIIYAVLFTGLSMLTFENKDI